MSEFQEWMLEEPEDSAQGDDAPPELPDYLQPPSGNGEPYGVLSYNRRSKCWTIRGDPAVAQLAKRLFHAGGKRGEARIGAHARALADLNWLMLRYPLEVASRDRALWESAMRTVREDAVRRAQLRKLPALQEPPESAFQGKLMEFQKAGVGWVLRNPRALLADEMGLGKTVQALAALALRACARTLIIVPPHLVANWQREIERFLRIEGVAPRVHVLRGLTPYALPDADIYIIHYLLLRGWRSVLPQLAWDSVIFDEIQELRHAGTEKYSVASLIAEHCPCVLGLSGTPIYNLGGEIWNVINIVEYHALGDWEGFSREWCAGYGNALLKNPEELGAHLKREGLMLRRTKQEVLAELPPKRRLVQPIDMDDALYRELIRAVLARLPEWEQAEGEFDRARLEETICQGERQATGVAKAAHVAAFVRGLLDAGERVLLCAHHHRVMDAYRAQLKAYHPVFITGREDARGKEQALADFMEGRSDVCVLSLRAASGLNLQRASCVVFGELDWSPAVHSQAEDRAHRIGQRDSVLCYYLVAPRGSDLEMQQALGLKVSQFVGLMGDAVPEEADVFAQQLEARSVMRGVVERLRAENRAEA